MSLLTVPGLDTARELTRQATELIASRYAVERHQIGAVLLDADGRTYPGLHVEAMVGRASICAEAVALGNAALAGAGPLTLVAAVRHPKPTEHGPPRLVPPCGLCREVLLDHAPGIHAVLPGPGGRPEIARLADMLPRKYVGTKWATQVAQSTQPTGPRTQESPVEPDFRTPALDRLASEVIPGEHFTLSADDARDDYFATTRMLDAKQLAYNRFRTNPRSMVDHLLQALELRGDEDLLDLGCGNGFVLEHLRPHMADGTITGLDIAPGVLRAAAERLRGVATPCRWVEGTADDLSRFEDASFDRVMATYMIHYVDDIGACLAEVRRVLRPGGRFVLTTDRPDALVELYEVHFDELRAMDAPAGLIRATPKARFSLDNGRELLQPHFDQVELRPWQDQLRFTDPDPLIDFYAGHNHMCASSVNEPGLEENFFAELRSRVRARVKNVIAERGHFAVTKFTGAFVCS